MTKTYSFVCNRVVTVWSRAIRAAVVEPVGLKPNWSAISSQKGWDPKVGYTKFRTKSRSMIRDRMGTTEIGLKSCGSGGLGTFGKGIMMAVFHCFGI